MFLNSTEEGICVRSQTRQSAGGQARKEPNTSGRWKRLFLGRELTTGAAIRQDQKGNRDHPLYRDTEKVRRKEELLPMQRQKALPTGMTV